MMTLLLLSAASIIGAASYEVANLTPSIKSITPSMTYSLLDRKNPPTRPLGGPMNF
jgi:hypothetical protein